MEIKLTLTLDEVNGLLTILGKLPTETNVWPLAAKIRSQAEPQLPPKEEGSDAEPRD
jgi:hypothetical protein